MLLFEIKKVLYKPLNKVAMLILIAVVFIGSFLTVRDVKYIDREGNISVGFFAARNLKEEKNVWKGYLTEDVLKDVIRKNNLAGNHYKSISEDVEENNRVAKKVQGFSDIREMINLAYGDIDNYDYYRIDKVSEKEVGRFYGQRIFGLKKYLNRNDIKENFSEDEKKWLISKYESLKTPIYYEYADGWKALLDYQYLPTLVMIAVLTIGFMLSGIFSDEFSLKSDSIFFSTKLGRSKAILSKMGAGFIITTIIYWCTILSFTMIVLSILGFSGGKCPVQTGISNWSSIYNITYFEDYLLSSIGGYIGSLFITIVAMFISAIMRSAVAGMSVPFILTCVPPFVGRIELFSRIMSIFPDQLLSINKHLEDFSLYHIGGNIYGVVYIIIPLYLIMYIIFQPIIYNIYRKEEIR